MTQKVGTGDTSIKSKASLSSKTGVNGRILITGGALLPTSITSNGNNAPGSDQATHPA